MSQIGALIDKLNRAGVEFKELGQLLRYEQPTKYLVSSTQYDVSYDIPVLTAGQSFVLGHTNEVHGIYPASKSNPVIIFDDFTTAFRWVDFRFKVKSSAMKMLTPVPGSGADFKFVYYAMLCIRFTPKDHARHWISQYSKFRIPCPPIHVQREIVKVLDTFVQLDTELQAELNARRQQYQYYRDALLTFADNSRARVASGQRTADSGQRTADSGQRWTIIGEICNKISSGGTPLASRPEYYDGDIPWLRTQEVRFVDIWDTDVKITGRGLEQSSAKWIPANCVIVAISGATAGRSAINKIPLTTNQHCCNLQVDPAKANYRYVFHWLSREYMNLKALGRGARSDLNSEIIKRFPILLPPIEEQNRVVAILDTFDTLVNDLCIGLPAELEARRQQYEYYRDRLLTFKEAA